MGEPSRPLRHVKKPMDAAAIASIVRHILTTLGGVIVANGLIDDNDLNSIVGGISVLCGVIWGYYNSKQKKGNAKQ